MLCKNCITYHAKFHSLSYKIAQPIMQNCIAYHAKFHSLSRKTYHTKVLILNFMTTDNFELRNNVIVWFTFRLFSYQNKHSVLNNIKFQIEKQKLESLWYALFTPQFLMSLVFVNNSELDKLVDHVHVRTVVFILAPTICTYTYHMTVQAAGCESVY